MGLLVGKLIYHNNHYYSCNALPEQQFEPICEYCLGNTHRKYMNEMRRIDNLEAE